MLNSVRVSRSVPTKMVWGLILMIVAAVALAAGREQWLPLLPSFQANSAAPPATKIDLYNHAHSDPGAADHSQCAGHDHPEISLLTLTPQARKNIGLQVEAVALKTYERSITIPAIIAERPGRSEIQVVAPLTGAVTKVYVIEGQAIRPGEPLFDLRVTHEDLVQAQTQFLRWLEELDVVNREVARMQPLVDRGVIPSKSLLMVKYEQEKLLAKLKAERQALYLHGLSEQQIQGIEQTRNLLRELRIYAPAGDVAATGETTNDSQAFVILETLKVNRGQTVAAGDPLCILVDHAELHIEGKAFERDAASLLKASREGWRLQGVLEEPDGKPELIDGLEILYVASKVESESRALTFYVRLPNQIVRDRTRDDGVRFVSWKFKPGGRLQLKVPVERWERRIVLPVQAVVRDGTEAYVFRQRGKKFARQPVHVEHSDPQSAVIANDGSLSAGDLVVISGASQMQLAMKQSEGGPVDPHAGHNH